MMRGVSLRTDLMLWFELAVRVLAGLVAVVERTAAYVDTRLHDLGSSVGVATLTGVLLLVVGAATLVWASAVALRRRG